MKITTNNRHSLQLLGKSIVNSIVSQQIEVQNRFAFFNEVVEKLHPHEAKENSGR